MSLTILNQKPIKEENLVKALFQKKIEKKGDTFYFYGEFDELDDRVSPNKNGNFEFKLKLLKQKIENLETVRVVIGVSRYNFFKVSCFKTV